MKGTFRTITLCVVTAILVDGIEPTPAHAQIMEGTYQLLSSSSARIGKLFIEEPGVPVTNDGTVCSCLEWSSPASQDGDLVVREGEDATAAVNRPTSPPTVVGLLHVPPHPGETTPYEEHWLLFPEYRDALAEGSTLSIEPLSAPPEVADKVLEAAATRGDVTYRHVVAQREELVDDASADSENPGVCDVAMNDSAVYFRTIWQRNGIRAEEARLVGFVRRSPSGFAAGEEQWCLTADYVYPTSGNRIATELRPASRGDLDAAAAELHQGPMGDVSPHVIRVGTADFLGPVSLKIGSGQSTSVPAPAAAARCSFGLSDPQAAWFLAVGFAGVALVRRRASRHQVSRC